MLEFLASSCPNTDVYSSFFSPHYSSEKLKCQKFLNEMEQVMSWKDMLNAIAPFYVEKQFGRKHKELKMTAISSRSLGN